MPTTPSGLTDSAILNGYVNNARDTASQALTGVADVGVAVLIYDGATQLGTTTADSNGAWSYTLGRLLDGTHKLTAVAVDGGGHLSAASEALVFKVDTRPPSQPGGLSDSAISKGFVNAVHNTADQTLTGKTDAGAMVTIYDDGTQIGSVKAGATGSWSFTLGQLTEGAHKLSATASDIAGNTSASSDALSFTVDTHAPGAPTGLADPAIIGGHVDPAHDLATQKLMGKAQAYSFVTVYDGATKLGVAQAGGTGDWSYTLGKLASGDHSLTATATDKAGNTGPSSTALAFTVEAGVNHPAVISGTLVANQVVTFDDLPSSSTHAPNGYAGFHWGYAGDLRLDPYASDGGDQAAANNNPAIDVTRVDGASFGVVSLDIATSEQFYGSEAKGADFAGYRQGVLVYSVHVDLANYPDMSPDDPNYPDTPHPFLHDYMSTVTLNFENIDKLIVYAEGYDPHLSNTYLIDNVAFVTNAPPNPNGTTTGVVAEDGELNARGVLSVTDPDAGEAHFQAPAAAALQGAYGAFTFNDGAWTYALNDGAANVQALARGQVVHDTLTVTSLDGTASQVIDVAIAGADEPLTANHIVTFDDLPNVAVGDETPTSYAGFNWTGFGAASPLIKNEYNSAEDTDYEAYNSSFLEPYVDIKRTDGSDFSIASLDIAGGDTSAVGDVETEVDIIGYKNGVEAYRTHVYLYNHSETIDLNYSDIDELAISSPASGRWFDPPLGQFSIDNLGFAY